MISIADELRQHCDWCGPRCRACKEVYERAAAGIEQMQTELNQARKCANERQGPCLEFKAADGQLSEWNESDRLRARVVRLESVLTAVAGVLQERLPAGAKRVFLLEVAAGVSAMASEIERLKADLAEREGAARWLWEWFGSGSDKVIERWPWLKREEEE